MNCSAISISKKRNRNFFENEKIVELDAKELHKVINHTNEPKKPSRLRKISRSKSENFLVDLNANPTVVVKRIQKKQKKFIEEEVNELAKLLLQTTIIPLSLTQSKGT